MNLTRCPEAKHVWANMMPNGGNAVRSRGSTVDDLGRFSKSASVNILQKFCMAMRKEGILTVRGTRSPSTLEECDHDLKYSFLPSWQVLNGILLNSRVL